MKGNNDEPKTGPKKEEITKTGKKKARVAGEVGRRREESG